MNRAVLAALLETIGAALASLAPRRSLPLINEYGVCAFGLLDLAPLVRACPGVSLQPGTRLECLCHVTPGGFRGTPCVVPSGITVPGGILTPQLRKHRKPIPGLRGTTAGKPGWEVLCGRFRPEPGGWDYNVVKYLKSDGTPRGVAALVLLRLALEHLGSEAGPWRREPVVLDRPHLKSLGVPLSRDESLDLPARLPRDVARPKSREPELRLTVLGDGTIEVVRYLVGVGDALWTRRAPLMELS